jgi:hypothetical protein
MRTLSFGLVDQHFIFMDERTDTYFTLDPSSERRLHRLLQDRKPLERDTPLLDALGIADEQLIVRQADYPSPSQSLLDSNRTPRPSVGKIVKTACLVLHTRSQLRTQGIERVLQTLSARSDESVTDEAWRDDISHETATFLGMRKLLPIGRNCLLDSLALLRWLGAYRSGVALLFGVKLDPFAAHCWVQSSGLVLNDSVETVAAFTPVRVIRCSAATP